MDELKQTIQKLQNNMKEEQDQNSKLESEKQKSISESKERDKTIKNLLKEKQDLQIQLESVSKQYQESKEAAGTQAGDQEQKIQQQAS